ncbi:hypothetical protein CYY_000712 [Polysphondylium violaceum]|uniref:ribonucleoside-triphosphate reductase (thioredoxin) n=1 Tax=Polysphondylium violaceum TaxID=133409 RepID=A0A8J4PZB6_9MYCE|nr:hypothetical protein CYY_000712 [Polysphondylium violaceum]
MINRFIHKYYNHQQTIGSLILRNVVSYHQKEKTLDQSNTTTFKPFSLSREFINKYKEKKAPFGFDILGELVYKRTYSRIKENGVNEEWYETVERVVNGTFNMQVNWFVKKGIKFDYNSLASKAEKMYEKIFTMKFLPPGRGLWAMGSSITEEKGLFAALNNCAFVSTRNLIRYPSKPFTFLMEASMLGVGVGFDTLGADGKFLVLGPMENKEPLLFTIPDSREGWVESVKLLLDSWLLRGKVPVEFDYSLIRPEGSPIKGFGGYSSGPESLKTLHQSLDEVLRKRKGQPVTTTTIVDIMNLIGRCVVSGNTRQTAEIAFGDPNSEEYINLKNYRLNPERQSYGWTSNNSVFANIGMDYTKVCERIVENGEPGFAWLSNMKNYSRMNAMEYDKKDFKAAGGNPCLEQTLESFELCCLVETFPNNHSSIQEYCETLEYAYLYAKTVTLGKTQWEKTNEIIERNRRIGCSMSGIAQFINSNSLDTLKKWCEIGYKHLNRIDRQLSLEFQVPYSIKKTSIKPSGTVSLLAGATPGMHYPISEYYIRRVRLHKDSYLLKGLIQAGYKVEIAHENPVNMVVEIPIHAGHKIKSVNQITMWEQLSLAAFLQARWADNQVSCTVSFDVEKEGPQLPVALDYFQYQLKGVSFLPRSSDGAAAYKQMPYEEITQHQYETMKSNLKPVNFNSSIGEEPTPDKYCDSHNCTIGTSSVVESELLNPNNQ